MHDLAALATFFSNHVEAALDELRQRVPPEGLENEALISSLRLGLNREFFELSYRTLIGHYKLVEQSVSYPEYVAALGQDEPREHLLRAYPVLQRWMESLAARWVENMAALITRFEADRAELSTLVGKGADQIRLEAVRLGLGDSHRGGKSVAQLQLSGGVKLLYKPRSLSIDAHFSQLLGEIGRGLELDFKLPKQVSKAGYGWVEYIEYTGCGRAEEIDLYYQRLGALLAILYVLGATDFHYENIIAQGAHPVLIDLETFFRPRTPILGTEGNEDSDNSVLRTGLLPHHIVVGEHGGGDISGMSDVEGQEAPVERLVLEQDENGEFVFRRARGQLLGAQNVPMLDGQKVALTADHARMVKQGFTQSYRHMASNKVELAKGLQAFADDEIRVLIRGTIFYTHLLDESRHPALLLSEDNVAAHFANIKERSKDYAIGALLVEDEITALQGRDVPLFTCLVGGTDLIVDDTRRLPGFFVRSGLDAVRQQIAELSERDLHRQLWIIDRSLKLANTDSARQPVAPGEVRSPADGSTSGSGSRAATLPDRLYRQAILIADHISEVVYQDDVHASWLVLKSMSEDNSELTIWNAFYDLYGGMPGEIAFLAQVAKAGGNAAHGDLADKALRYLEQRIAQASYSIRPLGWLGGWGSVIFLMTALARWRDDHSYHDRAEELLERIDFAQLIEVDRGFSLLKGCAGSVYAGALLYGATGSPAALALARKSFDHLMHHRADGEHGFAWTIASASPLSGLSHGASGFAVAFAKMFEVTQEERYRTACLEALRFERTLFVPEDGNWLDQRDYVLREGGPRCTASWAHGAPGIGIARMVLLKAGIETDEIVEDLHVALRTTLDAGLTGTFPIISGDFGRLELPLLYAETFGSDYWPATQDLIAEALTNVERHTEALSAARPAQLGLFSGLTGVGYQCLRIARNTSTPSLVGLDLAPGRRLLPWEA
ncbi:MAG TPA: type 2 lanthipeptide synthetase LanM [Allosphingosinicella sp.]|nr:type 2 lanthipeptide synthetase LanM [Allosphingosinicella sp.]